MAWGKPGGWAMDCEQNDGELLQQKGDNEKGGFGEVNLEPEADFPSLSTAVASKPSKKKKKAQAVSLAVFNTGASASPFSATTNKGLTLDEMAALPTAPRQRSSEELERPRGFRSYGSNGFDNSSNSRWGSSRQPDVSRKEGFERESSRNFSHSRADEDDDWGAGKKSAPGNGIERLERGGFFKGHSKVDESDNWGSNKSVMPPKGREFVPGKGIERRGRGGFFEGHSKADELDNWGSNKSFMPSEGRKFEYSGSSAFNRDRRGGFDSFSREGKNGNGETDSRTWGKKRDDVNGSAVSIGGRPRLNLQPRTQPLSNGQQPQGSGSVAKTKTTNPFGAARPREDVLAEKQHDFKKIDDGLDSMKIKEGSAAEGLAFGRGCFESGNSRVSSPDDQNEKD